MLSVLTHIHNPPWMEDTLLAHTSRKDMRCPSETRIDMCCGRSTIIYFCTLLNTPCDRLFLLFCVCEQKNSRFTNKAEGRARAVFCFFCARLRTPKTCEDVQKNVKVLCTIRNVIFIIELVISGRRHVYIYTHTIQDREPY